MISEMTAVNRVSHAASRVAIRQENAAAVRRIVVAMMPEAGLELLFCWWCCTSYSAAETITGEAAFSEDCFKDFVKRGFTASFRLFGKMLRNRAKKTAFLGGFGQNLKI